MYDEYVGGAGGYDPSSYSTSYSTTELFQPSNAYAGASTSYATGGYVPQPPPPQQATQITYQTIQPQAPPPQQQQQPPPSMMGPQSFGATNYNPQPGGLGGGHPGYGAAPQQFSQYRPQMAGSMGYGASPMNVGYPRQY